MSLEFYCRWGSTVEFLYIFKKYLKNWGYNVVGVLRFLEFFCLRSSTVSIPYIYTNRYTKYRHIIYKYNKTFSWFLTKYTLYKHNMLARFNQLLQAMELNTEFQFSEGMSKMVESMEPQRANTCCIVFYSPRTFF